jgi:signal transduction histidine kinase
MRERLVAAFVCVTLLTLVVFGVVRAYALESLIERSETVRVERSARLVGAVVSERQDHGEPVTFGYLRSLLGADEWVRYVAPNGRTMVARSAGYTASPSRADVADTVRLSGGGTLTFARSRQFVDDAVSDALMPVVLLAVGLALVAGALGYAVARRLSRPFQELAGVARDLGRGRFDVEVPHYAIPEADVVGRALETSAVQLHDLVVREREFVLTASHELNTPITALRLELEDLSLDPGLPAAATQQLRRSMGEVDRLSASVNHLLDAARERKVGVTSDVDVAQLACEVAARWQAAGRAVEVVGGPARVHLAAGPVEQILDDLVSQTMEDVTVEVAELSDHVRVRVCSPGPPSGVPAGARSVAEAVGAHLTVDRGPTTSYTLRLPRPH